MLKSSNINSVINEQLAAGQTASDQRNHLNSNRNSTADHSTCWQGNNQDALGGSLAAVQLSAGVLQIAEPPLDRVRSQLRELIGKQNKIYIDLSKEKYKLDCSEVAKLNDMMNDVKRYKEKLTRVKREMQGIYQRTKELKKRAANVAACKQRDYQRKLERQQHEESLIGGQKTQ
ncbi:biogenesis of lysosome-related organelles complex 1 subunit 6 [Drosophila miranda]|uniref:biogenesis of lysosome-related organelles complex 1 subunit 6 n=1 Tax=Drosophila miranda TaxID=7229 RepID=UPI0007E7B47F|nr:biogenesis of lysosome-related organelles complex 1 subunit 6 [Drosophila miranda]